MICQVVTVRPGIPDVKTHLKLVVFFKLGIRRGTSCVDVPLPIPKNGGGFQIMITVTVTARKAAAISESVTV
jgi:hypothetical protein